MSWRQILGHEIGIAAIKSAWRRERLAHAYLFVGPAGVGKHTFARQLGKTILCEAKGVAFDSCDQCPACKLVEAGTHPDLFQFGMPDDKMEFPIEVVREEVIPSLAMKPVRGARKIAIIDDADRMNDPAANCFLKTLEEPPPGSLLILVGGMNPERQLPTILSRCQVLRFSPLPSAQVKRVLIDKGVADQSRLNRLVQLANGSPGQALAVDDEAVWTFRKTLFDTLAAKQIDPAATAREWMHFIENAGKDAASHRIRASLIVRLLLVLLDTGLKLVHGSQVNEIDAAEERMLRAFGQRQGEERITRLIDRALEADLQIDHKVQLILVIEALLVDVCQEFQAQAVAT